MKMVRVLSTESKTGYNLYKPKATFNAQTSDGKLMNYAVVRDGIICTNLSMRASYSNNQESIDAVIRMTGEQTLDYFIAVGDKYREDVGNRIGRKL